MTQTTTSVELVSWNIEDDTHTELYYSDGTSVLVKNSDFDASFGNIISSSKDYVIRTFAVAVYNKRSERAPRQKKAPVREPAVTFKTTRPASYAFIDIPLKKEPRGTCSGQICWNCRNAVPGENKGCEWSISLRPVPGWEAEPVTNKENDGETIDTYNIKSCPKFVLDA